jgi:metal-responsive CopG/Arc/MetJ family transcriptional regulator
MKVKDGYGIINMQVDKADLEELDKIAEKKGILGRSNVVRLAISEFIKKEATA